MNSVSNSANDAERHQRKMEKQKAKVDAAIERAQEERGVVIVLTGTGKGKSSSGFGTVIRTLGHGYHAGIVQFIKGTWDCGEIKILKSLPNLRHEVMGSGFTWNTQDKEKDLQKKYYSIKKYSRKLKGNWYDIANRNLTLYKHVHSQDIIELIKRYFKSKLIFSVRPGANAPGRSLDKAAT